ncbi:hypothetical protein [Comamonas sp. SCN 65-56]|uniref:toxin-antitoxin system HicB family antitoxin n=1 Tax=Comamonas sp. SCN 65-56 TaxID=1660095 RepID=UPI0025C6A45A|nr:hypothetical protein [Comamonas sp. SCN 65-56]
MAVSVRMEPLLEKRLELAAQQKGITKSQFIIDAVERALGSKDPYALMVALKAEERTKAYQADGSAFADRELPYDTEGSRVALIARLKAKHGIA